MLGWLTNLDRLLRGDVTRPEELKTGQFKIDADGMAAAIVLLGTVYGICMSSYSLLASRLNGWSVVTTARLSPRTAGTPGYSGAGWGSKRWWPSKWHGYFGRSSVRQGDQYNSCAIIPGITHTSTSRSWCGGHSFPETFRERYQPRM